MLQELVKYLVDLGVKHREPKLLPFLNNRDKAWVVTENGFVEKETPREAPPTHSVARTIEDFAKAITTRCAEASCEPPTIWLTPQRALAVFDVHREQSLTVPFDPHPQVTALLGFEQPKTLDQTQLVRLLRHTLAGCVADASVLVRFREINWENQSAIRRKVQNASSSMDSDIVSRATTVGGLPAEEFEANVPLFVTRDLKQAKAIGKLTVDIDAAAQKFTLELLPGEADAIREEMLAVLRRQLLAAMPQANLIAGLLHKA